MPWCSAGSPRQGWRTPRRRLAQRQPDARALALDRGGGGVPGGGVLRWPMIPVVLVVVPISIALAWWAGRADG
ncbi:hypothetical protein ACFQU2_04745 [Siccirubricoccus deserti]